MKRNYLLGCFSGIMTGICWAISGVFGQFLFEQRGIVAAWLVPVRLVCSGVLLFTYLFFTNREELLSIPRNRRDLLHTVVAGVCGTMVAQAAFFWAVQASNAATATVLQYLAPVIILIYTCLRLRRRPVRVEVLAMVLAVGGIFLIATHGNIHTLVMTPEGLFWGLANALGMVMNSIIPVGLYKKYSTQVVMAWAFLFGGVALSLMMRPWQYEVVWNGELLLAMFVIVVIGSVSAFWLYAVSVKLIGPARASLFSTSEPVAATVLSALYLGTSFLPVDLIGFAMILAIVFLLTLTKQPEQGGDLSSNT